MTNMAPTQVQDLIDHAAGKSDRWLMIALLVFILLGGCWLIKVVLGSMMKQMTDLVAEFTKDRGELVEVIKENTKASAAHAENARSQAESLREMARAVDRCNRYLPQQ